jgi:hypothetical protein
MFIERGSSKRFLLAPAERNESSTYLPLPETSRSAGAQILRDWIYKHLAPLEPGPNVVAALPHYGTDLLTLKFADKYLLVFSHGAGCRENDTEFSLCILVVLCVTVVVFLVIVGH